MQKIDLTQGRSALVDDKDFEYLNQFKWQYNNGYASRTRKVTEGDRGTIWMHREILNTPVDKDTDHINGDTLDNRGLNLRVCTRAQNQRNRHIVRGMSKFKGVHWSKAAKKWEARIKAGVGRVTLGYFDIEEDAALAYNTAALKYFEEFARLNIL